MSKTNLPILCYHEVADEVPEGYNSSGKHTLLTNFERQIAYVSRRFEIVTIRDIENFANGGCSLHPECAAITFDDGGLLCAKPHLYDEKNFRRHLTWRILISKDSTHGVKRF